MKKIECPHPKEFLEKLYLQDKLSITQIAAQLNLTNPKMVWTWLKRYEIPIRAFTTKGIPSTKKGVPLPNDVKLKISEAKKGTVQKDEQKQKHHDWMLANNPFRGKKHSEETREKMRQAKVGMKFSDEAMIQVRKRMDGNTYRLGATHTDEARQKISLANRRPCDLGQSKKEMKRARRSAEMRIAKQATLIRDGHKCVLCGRTTDLVVDHIKPFSIHPELRVALDNLRTLCMPCHRKTDTYGVGIKHYPPKAQN